MTGDHKIIYFAKGAAEPLVHCLKIAGIPFTMEQVSNEEFKEMNGRGAILDIDGRKFYNVPAAMRYAGRMSDGWGWQKDPFKAVVADEAFENILYVKWLIGSANHLEGENEMIDRRNQIAEEELPELLEMIDNQVAKVGKGTFFAEGVSVIDCEVTAFVTWLTNGRCIGIPTNIMENYNNVVRIHYQTMRHPKIGRNIYKGASDV